MDDQHQNGDEPSAAGLANKLAETLSRKEEEIGKEEKSASDSLIEALSKFIAQQNAKPQINSPDTITTKQYLGLVLFCFNATILYLTVKSLFPTLIKGPLWQLTAQVVSIAVGGSFIVAKSKQLQSWLLSVAVKKRFIASMGVLSFFLVVAGLTQTAHFEIPIDYDVKNVTQICAEPVDDLSAVGQAVLHSDAFPSQNCAGGRPQIAADGYLRSLRLFQKYMITAAADNGGRNDRFYLPATTVFKRSLGFATGTLSLDTVVLTIEHKSSGTIKLRADNSNELIFVPEGCSVGMNPSEVITCNLSGSSAFYVRIMPGKYKFTVDGCSVRPENATVSGNSSIKVSCGA